MPKTLDLETVRQCATESRTITELCHKLGYRTFSSVLRKMVNDNLIDIRHLKASHKYIDDVSDDAFREIVKKYTQWIDIANECGYRSYKGVPHIKDRCEKLGIDISHVGSFIPEPSNPLYSLDEICVENSWYSGSVGLIRRLIKELKWERKCMTCGLSEWQGKTIPLELHHINGKHFDHRITNLQLLCPNCHAQTDTYTGKNVGNRGERGLIPDTIHEKPKPVPKPKTKSRKTSKCTDCGEGVRNGIKRCLECYRKHSRRVERPPYEQLKKEIDEMGYTHTGEKYGVSDNSIRKWVVYYEKEASK